MLLSFTSRTKFSNNLIAVLGKNDVFGENPFKHPTIGKSSSNVKSFGYCDLHKISRDELCFVYEMWPEFVESFNANLNITFDLRDESQAGLPAMRFRRDGKGKRITSRLRNLDPMAGAISEFSPQSEEEEEEIVAAHLQGNGFRTFLAPSSFEYEDESELDPYVYPKNGKRSGVLELSPAKAGMDVTPACYDFPKRKSGKNKRSATMHSLASALSNVTNLALGAARHHHSSPLRTRASTESDHQQQINRTNRVMASVDEEERTTVGNALTQAGMQSLDSANLGRTGRTGSGTLSAAAMPYSATATHPTTRAERSSAALYAAILNRVDHIQNQMNNYENMLLQKMDGLTRLLQLTLPESIVINGRLTKVEDLLLEPLTIPVNGMNGGNQSKLQMPIINSSLTQQSSTSRMCKSYTDLVSSLKRGSTITLEEHPKSEHSDPAGRAIQPFTATHSSLQQPSTTRPTLQQQRISLKYPFRNAHSMFENYDHNNNNSACQSTLQPQLSTTTAPTNLATTSTMQAPSSTNYLTTSTNFNLGHSLASLELSDIDLDELDEVNMQTGELQLLINQPVTVQPETTTAASVAPSQLSTNQSASTTTGNPPSATLRPRSPFDHVSSSYSNRPLFQRAASSSITTTDQPFGGGQELRLSRSSSSNLVAHETAISSRLGSTTLTSVTTGVPPLSSTITQSSTAPNAAGSTNQTQRKDNHNKNVDNV